jgi:transposase-like protein
MGGYRVCPGDCPVAKWENLSAAERKAQRKAITKEMHKRGMTPERIAKELGMVVSTVYSNLEFSEDRNTHSPCESKRGRKGEGRPRGGKRGGSKRKTPQEKLTAAARARRQGKTQAEAAQEAGLASVHNVKIAEAHDDARSSLLNELHIDPETLTLPAQAKLKVFELKIERRLEDEYAARMRNLDEEVRQRVLKESAEYLAMLNEERAKAHESEKWYRELIDNHKPQFTIDEFKAVLMCLHPDGERTPEKLNEAFRLFNSRKFQLTGERPMRRVA